MQQSKKKLFLALTLSAALLASIIPATLARAATTQQAKTYKGYLMDSYCGAKGYDQFDKIDVKKSPEKHPTSCLMMDVCMKSGLGVSLKLTDGTYKFYKFDTAGSKMADDNIMMMTKKKTNLQINVTGVLNGNSLKVSSVKEIK